MVIVRLGAQPDLFDLDDLLRLFGFSLFLRQLVQELAIVHDLAHGGLGRGRDFDKVKFTFAGEAESFLNRHNADVLSIGADQPDFTDTDAFVNAMVSGANTLSLSLSKRARIRSRAQRGEIITQRTQIVNSDCGFFDARPCEGFRRFCSELSLNLRKGAHSIEI